MHSKCVFLGGTMTNLSTCYSSVHLSPTTKTICVRVGFCHRRACTPLTLGDTDTGTIVIMQYLDDIPFVGCDRGKLKTVTTCGARAVAKAAFVSSPKSIIDPVGEVL